MTYVQGQHEEAAHAKTQRRKERQKRLPSWDRRNGLALRPCGFARPCRCLKRRLTQRRQGAKKGNNDLPLGKEETALLCGLCGFARPCRCLKRRLTQRRKDAKKGKNGFLLGTEETALLCALAALRGPAVVSASKGGSRKDAKTQRKAKTASFLPLRVKPAAGGSRTRTGGPWPGSRWEYPLPGRPQGG